MKAMVLKAPRELGLENVAPPRPNPDQVLIRVTNSGVCGTDLKIFNGSIPVRYPLIMGHEMIGEVVEGADGDPIRRGDRVIVDPAIYCGTCFDCQAGRTHLCPRGFLVGRDAHGGFADYIAAPRSHVFRLPDSIDNQTAPLIQVLTTCLHAQRLVNIFPGESVVVLGLGVTGQVHVQLAKARGASLVIGITRSAWKRELAAKLGADITLPPGENTVREVLQATHGHGADLIIDSTGILASIADGVSMARRGANLLLFGFITAKEGALPFYQLYFKELALFNPRAAKNEDFPPSIDLVRRGLVRLQPLVSHVLSLAELGTALGMLGSEVDQRMKIILENR